MARILVGNKVDLERSREVSVEGKINDGVFHMFLLSLISHL